MQDNTALAALSLLMEGDVRSHSILTHPNKILTTVAEPVSDEDGRKLVTTLENALYDSVNEMYRGVGLAAPQIGIPHRVCIIRYGQIRMDLINPVIVDRSFNTTMAKETCLSVPNKSYMVPRSSAVTVRADSLLEDIYIDDMQLARIIQHEIDHLNGRTIVEASAEVKKKIGRNEKCPCGSGTKYKKCCLNK